MQGGGFSSIQCKRFSYLFSDRLVFNCDKHVAIIVVKHYVLLDKNMGEDLTTQNTHTNDTTNIGGFPELLASATDWTYLPTLLQNEHLDTLKTLDLDGRFCSYYPCHVYIHNMSTGRKNGLM